MKALLVIDIQPEVMAGRDVEGLVERANAIIAGYAPEQVVYIANLKPFAPVPAENPFAPELDVVSDKVLFKRRSSAFANPKLAETLAAMGADEVELIGIDGNWCIKATALAALRHGLKTTVNTTAVASKNPHAFECKTKPKLQRAGANLI